MTDALSSVNLMNELGLTGGLHLDLGMAMPCSFDSLSEPSHPLPESPEFLKRIAHTLAGVGCSSSPVEIRQRPEEPEPTVGLQTGVPGTSRESYGTQEWEGNGGITSALMGQGCCLSSPLCRKPHLGRAEGKAPE